MHAAPEGFGVAGEHGGTPVAAFENAERGLPACSGTPRWCTPTFGQRVIENFLPGRRLEPTGPRATSSTSRSAGPRPGRRRQGVCALSGGVDSSVAAALVQRAVGDQLTCVFVDHGLLRAGRGRAGGADFVAATGVDLVVVDAGERFLDALAGVTDPEDKRKIIGREFIRVFEQAARDVVSATSPAHGASSCRARCTRTSWSPVAARARRTSRATTTSGASRTTCSSNWSSRCGMLFKDEVRAVGLELGVPELIVWRQPFPGPGPRDPHHRRGHRGAARRRCAPPTRSRARS